MHQAIAAFVGMALCVGASPAVAQTSEEVELAKSVFNRLQPLSFANNSEYCGYFGYDSRDTLVASSFTRGDADGCAPDVPPDLEVVASFHTHGAYADDAVAELPSPEDLEADLDEGVDGWVATPGGRLWFIDTERLEVWQVCGVGCLQQDANFQPEWEVRIAEQYSFDALVELWEENFQ
ncbi:MAG: DUF4329 domain-containing protein [Devosiaceae bacterium]|nr:DUF4329 domain-containing protein [Devosiaceae bacterium MH13]